MKTDAMITTYRNGDKIGYTGISYPLAGMIAFEFVYLDGIKKGETGVTYKAPKEYLPCKS
jgi:hypothetical protein